MQLALASLISVCLLQLSCKPKYFTFDLIWTPFKLSKSFKPEFCERMNVFYLLSNSPQSFKDSIAWSSNVAYSFVFARSNMSSAKATKRPSLIA